MPNLLQKASIVLTPTAYNDGEVLCAKPDDGSGDFDFSRNSAATRVNAQGLVENVQILSSNLVQNGNFSEEGVQEVSNGSFSQEGSELITNGDFSNGSTGWQNTFGGEWVISGGKATLQTGADGTYLSAVGNILTTGKSYKAVITTSGGLDANNKVTIYANSNTGKSIEADGTHTLYFTANGTVFRFSGVANDNPISIDNVSVREVAQDWTLGTGWSIGEDKAVLTNVGYNINCTQSNVTTIGQYYKVEFTILDYISGQIRISLGGNATSLVSANGTYVFYLQATINNVLALQPLYASGTNLSITNISVKEVGMDWTLGTGWSIGENKAISDATQGYITQTDVSGAGVTATYKVQWTQNITTGTRLRFFARNYNDGGNATTLSITRDDGASMGGGNCIGSGTFTAYVSSTNGYSFKMLAETGAEADITNITTIEITDDTNLPRINYEGFSYQDALGSEEVVNGTFDSDTAWNTSSTGISISGGKLSRDATATSNIVQINSAIKPSVPYEITFEIVDYTSGTLKPRFGYNGTGGTPVSGVGTYTQIITKVDQPSIELNGTSFIGSIDNVSVKEYLGQEVVPNSGCGSWLWEPQSTNLFEYSEDFNSGGWSSLGNSSQGFVTGIAPNGATSVYEITSNGGGGKLQHTISGLAINTEYTLSFYAKKESDITLVQSRILSLTGGSGGTNLTAVNYQNDLITDQWVRITHTFTTNDTLGNYILYISNALTSGDTLQLWGAQLEQKSYATSYIPTSGSQVTRNQDLCNNGATGAGLINSTEGVLYAEIAALSNENQTNRYITISSGSTSNRMILRYTNTGVSIYIIANGTSALSSGFDFADRTQTIKAALRWANNDVALFVDGIKRFQGNSFTTYSPNTLNRLNMASVNGGSFPFFGKTKALAVWKEALSDQELADLTYPTPTDPTFTLDFDTIAEQFTFARGSEATYVDAQGLIKSTNELGPELVVNGDFATDSDWIKSGGVVISSGKAVFNAPSLAILYQNLSGTTQGTTYKVTYTISEYISGSIFFGFGNGIVNPQGTIRNANGTYTEYITKTDALDSAGFRTNAFIGSIDNVSVKEYITATNTPRLDYSTGAEAFLLEPQSTNLIRQSEDLSNMQIAFGGAISLDSNFTNPSGQNGSYFIYDTDGGSEARFRVSNNGFTLGDKLSYSVFLKSNSSALITIGGNYGGESCVFNVGTKTLISQGTAVDSYKIINFTNGWTRYIVNTTFTDAIGTGNAYPFFTTNATLSEKIYLWGHQLEQQSFATSYIPSNGSQTTRNQETCVNATPEINSEEGVLYWEGVFIGDNYKFISLSDGTATNRVSFFSQNQNTIAYNVRNSSGNQMNGNYSIDATIKHKVALKYKENDFALWIDGVEVVTDNSGTTFSSGTLNKLSYNGGTVGSSDFYGNTKDLQVYTKALSDAELIKLTT